MVAANHLLLLPPSISGIGIDTAFIISIVLTAVPNLDYSRRNHSNKVALGQLHIDSSEHPPTAELVATKYLHRLRVPPEIHASLIINKRFSKQLVFAPLGFVKGKILEGFWTSVPEILERNYNTRLSSWGGLT